MSWKNLATLGPPNENRGTTNTENWDFMGFMAAKLTPMTHDGLWYANNYSIVAPSELGPLQTISQGKFMDPRVMIMVPSGKRLQKNIWKIHNLLLHSR